MIKNITALAATLLIGAAATTAQAQDDGRGSKGKRRPAPPLIAALDANRDGIIDAAEVSNASTALAELDANGDGQLTRDELRLKGGRKGPRYHGRVCCWSGAGARDRQSAPEEVPTPGE